MDHQLKGKIVLVKIHKCDTCTHPSDDHSTYRDRCLHDGCDCTRSTEAFPYQGPQGLLLSGTVSTLSRLAARHV